MDINDIAAKAAAKIDAARDTKVNAVKQAAASGVEVQEAAQLLAAAEQKYAKDYQAALRADWTESDLRGFGLDAPTKKAGGRPRGRRAPQESTPGCRRPGVVTPRPHGHGKSPIAPRFSRAHGDDGTQLTGCTQPPLPESWTEKSVRTFGEQFYARQQFVI